MKTCVITLGVIVSILFWLTSCKGAPASFSANVGPSKTGTATTAPKAAEPQKPPSIAPAKAPQESAYPGEGQILAAVGLDSDSFSWARFYLAKIKTPASAQTKNQYEAELLTSTSNYGKGHILWTDNVIRKTHKLSKDEIKVGLVVLYPAGTHIWSRAVVSDTSNLFKDEVTLDLYWGSKPDSMDRKAKWKIQDLRVSEDPVFRSPR